MPFRKSGGCLWTERLDHNSASLEGEDDSRVKGRQRVMDDEVMENGSRS